MQQIPHGGNSELWLLHGKDDEIVIGRIHVFGRAGGNRARHRFCVELNGTVDAPHRQADDAPLAVYQLGLFRKTDQMRRVPGKRGLCAE